MALLLLALAGALGALSRYGLSALVHRWAGQQLPWGTLAVNVLGCLLFGVLFSLLDGRTGIRPEWRLAALSGFLGSFTTFSTFSFESVLLVRQTDPVIAALHVVLQIALGIGAVVLGLAAGRALG